MKKAVLIILAFVVIIAVAMGFKQQAALPPASPAVSSQPDSGHKQKIQQTEKPRANKQKIIEMHRQVIALVSEGNADGADHALREMEAAYPGFSETGLAGHRMYYYRCKQACNAGDPVRAMEELAAMAQYYPTFNYREDEERVCASIDETIRSALKAGTLAGQLSKLDAYWIFLPAEQVSRTAKVLQEAGLQPTPAMRAACEHLNSGAMAPPAAFIRRSWPVYIADKHFDPATAWALAQRALTIAREEKKPLPLLDALISVALMADVRGDLESGYDAASEAVKIAEEVQQPGRVVTAKFFLGLILEKMSDFRRAADAYSESIALCDQYGETDDCEHTRSFLYRTMCQVDATAASDVEQKLRKRVAEVESANVEPCLAWFAPNLNLGICLSKSGKHAEAIKAFRRSITRADHDDIALVSVEIGRCFLALNKPAAAEKAFADAERSDKEMPSAEVQWGYQFGNARARYMQNDDSGTQKWLDRALKTVEAQRASLKDFHNRRTLLDNKYGVYDLAIEMALKRGAIDEAFDYAERSRSRAFLDAIGNIGDSRPVVLSNIKAVQQASNSFSTVIFFQRENEVLAWIVSKEKVELVKLPYLGAQLFKDVQDFHVSLLSADYHQKLKGKNAADAISAAKTLYANLWKPLEQKLPPGQRVCLIPHRLLHYIPFQALHDGKQFLIESREIFYAPSGSALVELLKRQPSAEAESVAIFDAVKSEDRTSVFFNTPTAHLKELYPKATVFVRELATVEQFKESASSGLIHVTAHGSFDQWFPARSGLHLSAAEKDDGVLRAQEIYKLNMQSTELVVLCSCVSSVGDLADGDEVTGVTRAFQVAGAQNVIGSLWPVEVTATNRLMGYFHDALKTTPADPVRALCAAQRRYIKEEPAPAKWAAFEVNGTGTVRSSKR